MTFQIVPSIDLRQGRVVRLKQGDYGQQTTYDVDPFAVARSFADAGARWMHIVDLDGAREGRCVQAELVSRLIAASGLQVQTGGGVRETEDVLRLLAAGASRVVVGTRALEDMDWFRALAHRADMHERLVLALDARDGMVAVKGWTETSSLKATEVAERVCRWPLAGILYTDVSRDGMLAGPNIDATAQLAESAAPVPVIASGGVGTLAHITALAARKLWGVIVGRAIYEGAVDLRLAIEAVRLPT